MKTNKTYCNPSNHLGNVLAVITDRRLQACGASDVMYYQAQIVSISDYYLFGMQIKERGYSATNYRCGFNGMEADNEGKGAGNSYDFGARIYDSRLGRWMSVDPLRSEYPSLSPYCFAGNSVLQFVDFEGNEIKKYIIEKTHSTALTNKHDLGFTDHRISFRTSFDEKTRKATVTIEIPISYHDVFSKKGSDNIEVENPGLFNQVKAHEEGHVERIFQVARVSYVTLVFQGKEEIGPIDEVLTTIAKKLQNDIISETKKKISEGYFNSQEEVNKYIIARKKLILQ